MNPIDRFRLDGRIAVVTGGARGIGFAVAELSAAAGADMSLRNGDGHDVYYLARAHRNKVVEQALMKLTPPER